MGGECAGEWGACTGKCAGSIGVFKRRVTRGAGGRVWERVRVRRLGAQRARLGSR